jgi:hypothetical protein
VSTSRTTTTATINLFYGVGWEFLLLSSLIHVFTNMTETIEYLESLFYNEGDAVDSQEREEHNAHVERAINGLSSLSLFVKCVNKIVAESGEVSPDRLAVWKSIQQSELFVNAEKLCAETTNTTTTNS